MQHLKRLLAVTVIPALLLTVLAVSGVMAQGPAGKTTICHAASHKYVEITVSDNALPAHMNHGDVMPDEYGACP